MERKINSCGVTFINFADFDLAEFVDEITADCSLMRDIGESSKKGKIQSLLAQQGDSVERTVTFPKYPALGVTVPVAILIPPNNLY